MKTLKRYLSNNILYIHGLGSDANSSTFKTIKSMLPNYNVYTTSFDLLNPNHTLQQIDHLIKKYNITKIIASSLGGFYALCVKDSVAKIVINPCMHPSIEVPKLTSINDELKDAWKDMEKEIYSGIDGEQRMCTFGVFGKDDELFSYKDEFKKKYGKFIYISGKHRLNDSQLGTALEAGLNYFTKTNHYLKEELINEHFVNIFTKEIDSTVNQYKEVVYDLLQKSYAPIGGLLGVNDPDQLVLDSDMWKLVTRGSKVVAVAIYSMKRGGRKMIACGSDGTPEGKKDLYKILQEDIKMVDRKMWAEVSGAMEHIYINKQGARPVPAEVAQILMKDKNFIKIHDDGFHYDRLIAGEVHTKILIGNP